MRGLRYGISGGRTHRHGFTPWIQIGSEP
jgi:hypothetical protein